MQFICSAVAGDERLLLVRSQNKEFLLQLFTHDGGYLVKAEKSTRVTPVGIVKEALRRFAVLSQAEVTHSNLEGGSARQEQQSRFLVEPRYFIDDFKTPEQLVVEVGFGSGRHLLHRAIAEPDVHFIGIELHTPSIEQVVRQIELQKLENIRVIAYDARIFLELLGADTVDEIIVHFPIPWDKKPHLRVISRPFIDESIRVLKPEGVLYLRTDSDNYFRYSFQLLMEMNSNCLTIYKNRDLTVSSKYEDRWKRQNKDIYDLIMTNQECSRKDTTPVQPFSFPSSAPQLPDRSLVREENYFVSVKGSYRIEPEGAILKVVIGDYAMPEQKFLLFHEGEVRYVGGQPIPSQANRLAHEQLCRMMT